MGVKTLFPNGVLHILLYVADGGDWSIPFLQLGSKVSIMLLCDSQLDHHMQYEVLYFIRCTRYCVISWSSGLGLSAGIYCINTTTELQGQFETSIWLFPSLEFWGLFRFAVVLAHASISTTSSSWGGTFMLQSSPRRRFQFSVRGRPSLR